MILAIVLTGIAFGEDEFTQHLGKNVTVNVCNMTVYQGNMTEWWALSRNQVKFVFYQR